MHLYFLRLSKRIFTPEFLISAQFSLKVNPSIEQFWSSYVKALLKLDRLEEAKSIIFQCRQALKILNKELTIYMICRKYFRFYYANNI